LTILELTILE
jgi:hypothetical protein